MTEGRWLRCDQPSELLDHLRPSRPSPRKLRLFACACLRRHEGALRAHPDRLRVLEAVEGLCDGAVGPQAVFDALAELGRPGGDLLLRAVHSLGAADPLDASIGAAGDVAADVGARATDAAREGGAAGGGLIHFEGYLAAGGERAAQAALLRDIFANPYRRVVGPPSWGTDAAVGLARQMYESRDFGAMPLLADALRDAGCDSDDVLDHCRGPGPHVRGCWVVDLVLGKE